MSGDGEPRAKILIVDDEESIVRYLAALLEDHGYATRTALDGVEGMAKVRNEAPDLICLDITMPHKSGLRLYQELREDEAFDRVKVVVVTAVTTYEGDPEPFKRFLETRPQFAPPDAFVSKPIDREAFVETIQKVLENAPSPRAT